MVKPNVLLTVNTEPLVTHMLLIRCQSTASTAPFTQFACALLSSTSFAFVITKARLTLKLSIEEAAVYSNRCRYKYGLAIQSVYVQSHRTMSYLHTFL